MGGDASREIFGSIAAFQQRDDAPATAARGDLHDAQGHLGEIALDQPQAAERVVQPRVEPRAHDNNIRSKAVQARQNPLFERRAKSHPRPRGLRSIMEGILLETMFDLPGLEGVEEVVISRDVVEATARPLYIYADRSDRAVESSASA